MSIFDKIADKIDKLYGPHYMTISELCKKYPLNEELTDDDTIQISHKRSSDGEYETRFMTLRQLKDYLKN